MLASANAGRQCLDLRGAFRSILLFHNRPVSLPKYDGRKDYLIGQLKKGVYQQLSSVVRAFGTKGVQALRDTVWERIRGPAASQLAAPHRRYFAEELFHEGVLNTEEAGTLGLSSKLDAQDDDPMQRQEACLGSQYFCMQSATRIGAGSGDARLARCRLVREATKTIIWLNWRNGLIARSSPISRLRSWRFLKSLPEQWRSQG